MLITRPGADGVVDVRVGLEVVVGGRDVGVDGRAAVVDTTATSSGSSPEERLTSANTTTVTTTATITTLLSTIGSRDARGGPLLSCQPVTRRTIAVRRPGELPFSWLLSA
ncbi:hypothetical protein Aglo03_27250 [Actinokineospora globicatena]|uniref:Uncharacterized protein n=1 Tax=Actinokineospora globicatena TaxID=103729 RepID=A0A9W6V9F2_9PSEU|nr:hypothetical protein Aglo03_27250 [Actinokineospora globicatena]